MNYGKPNNKKTELIAQRCDSKKKTEEEESCISAWEMWTAFEALSGSIQVGFFYYTYNWCLTVCTDGAKCFNWTEIELNFCVVDHLIPEGCERKFYLNTNEHFKLFSI